MCLGPIYMRQFGTASQFYLPPPPTHHSSNPHRNQPTRHNAFIFPMFPNSMVWTLAASVRGSYERFNVFSLWNNYPPSEKNFAKIISVTNFMTEFHTSLCWHQPIKLSDSPQSLCAPDLPLKPNDSPPERCRIL